MSESLSITTTLEAISNDDCEDASSQVAMGTQQGFASWHSKTRTSHLRDGATYTGTPIRLVIPFIVTKSDVPRPSQDPTPSLPDQTIVQTPLGSEREKRLITQAHSHPWLSSRLAKLSAEHQDQVYIESYSAVRRKSAQLHELTFPAWSVELLVGSCG